MTAHDPKAAERMRRLRARRASGTIVLPVPVDEIDHVEKLVACGFLARSKAEDRDEVAKATARLLRAVEAVDLQERDA